MTRRDVLGIVDLRARPAEVAAQVRSVLERAGDGQPVALVVARDLSHAVVVAPELARELGER